MKHLDSIFIGTMFMCLLVGCFIGGYDYHKYEACELRGYSYSWDLSVCVRGVK